MVYSILTSHNDNHQYINHQYIKVIMDHYFVDAEKEEEDDIMILLMLRKS